MREGSFDRAYSRMPLSQESDKEKVLENLKVQVEEIFNFLNTNQEAIQEAFGENSVLEASHIENNLNYIRENIKGLNPLLERHCEDVLLIFNHLMDRLGTFVGGDCGIIDRIISHKSFSPELFEKLKTGVSVFAKYLKDILEDENFLKDEIRTYNGQALH